jgi:hypothetical protein
MILVYANSFLDTIFAQFLICISFVHMYLIVTVSIIAIYDVMEYTNTLHDKIIQKKKYGRPLYAFKGNSQNHIITRCISLIYLPKY